MACTLLLQAASILENTASSSSEQSNAQIQTQTNVVVFDILTPLIPAKVMSVLEATRLLGVTEQQLDTITTSMHLFGNRYFVNYTAALPTVPTCLKVNCRIEDDSEAEDNASSAMEKAEGPVKRCCSNRFGEIRKGKSVKVFSKSLKTTYLFNSQDKCAQFLGVKKGTVSAVLIRKKNPTIRGWQLSRV
jgi:hypothetical protein